MLQPNRTKYRKQHKGRNRCLAHKGSSISFGSFALKSLEFSQLNGRQLEAARIALTRNMKRKEGLDPCIPGQTGYLSLQRFVWVKKGAVDHYVCEVQPGRIILK